MQTNLALIFVVCFALREPQTILTSYVEGYTAKALGALDFTVDPLKYNGAHIQWRTPETVRQRWLLLLSKLGFNFLLGGSALTALALYGTGFAVWLNSILMGIYLAQVWDCASHLQVLFVAPIAGTENKMSEDFHLSLKQRTLIAALATFCYFFFVVLPLYLIYS